MTEKESKFLTSRYYTWELSVLVVAVLLIIWQIFGLSDTALPIVGGKLRDPSKFPLVTCILLAIAFLLLWVEWKQSEKTARGTFWARMRFGCASALAVVAVWINLPALTQGTALAGISALWFAFYLFIGFGVGTLATTIVFISLMARSDESAKFTPNKIPVATQCTYKMWLPVLIILLVLSYAGSLYAPFPILRVASWVTALPILYSVAQEIINICFHFDKDGHRMPVRERLSKLREIFKMHDYLYYLNRNRKQVLSGVSVPPNATPQQQQKAIREHFLNNPDNSKLRSVTLEEFFLEPYLKDGDSNNHKPENVACRVKFQNPKVTTLRVRTFPAHESPPKNVMELAIKINLLEKYATEFFQQNVGKRVSQQSLISYIIDHSVLDTLSEMAATGGFTQQLSGNFPLHDASFSNRLDLVEEFLTKGNDVNEMAPNGWTPLLAAIAQGNTQIAKFLLERGANPDISNLQRITPLMYAARYGNLADAKLLLDFGASLDLQDIHGDTALAVAVMRGQEKLVKLFLEKGAKTDTRNTFEKMTPLDLAHRLGHGKIAKLLRNKK